MPYKDLRIEKKFQKKYRENNTEYFRLYQKLNRKKYYGKYNRKITKQTRIKAAQYAKAYRIRNPLKHKARYMLRNAVSLQKILKPNKCTICKEIRKIEGHHTDYRKPLNVIWLCKPCHRIADYNLTHNT